MSASIRNKIFTFQRLFNHTHKVPTYRCCNASTLPVKDILAKRVEDEKLSISAKGWITYVRRQKKYVFLSLTDGSGSGRLQIVADANICSSDLSPGCSVHVEGDLVKSPAKGQATELVAKTIEVTGKCSEDYPLDAKATHTLEYARSLPHLRARTEHHKQLLKVRNVATMAVHKYFQDNDFLFVHTPVLTSNDCEGAGEMFRVKTSKDEIQSSSNGSSNDTDRNTTGQGQSHQFFGHPAFLTVSGQLHLEAISGAFPKAYNFGPTFRAENSPGRHHLAEFYMIEAEMAFTENIECILQVMENLVISVTRDVMEQVGDDVNSLWKHSTIQHQHTIADKLLKAPFVRMPYSDAINILEKNNSNFSIKAKWGCDLSKEHEKYLVKYCENCPVFVTDFPTTIKPFYARENTDSQTVSAVDLLVPEVGELFGGSLREERYDVLKSQLDKLDLSQQYQWYLDLRRYGSVAHGGFGMGFERYLQCLLGINNIKDTIPFPRWVNHCAL